MNAICFFLLKFGIFVDPRIRMHIKLKSVIWTVVTQERDHWCNSVCKAMLPQVSRKARFTCKRAYVGFSGGIESMELTDFAVTSHCYTDMTVIG